MKCLPKVPCGKTIQFACRCNWSHEKEPMWEVSDAGIDYYYHHHFWNTFHWLAHLRTHCNLYDTHCADIRYPLETREQSRTKETISLHRAILKVGQVSTRNFVCKVIGFLVKCGTKEKNKGCPHNYGVVRHLRTYGHVSVPIRGVRLTHTHHVCKHLQSWTSYCPSFVCTLTFCEGSHWFCARFSTVDLRPTVDPIVPIVKGPRFE